MSKQKNTIYTIGHSNHEMKKFLELLKQYDVEVVVDVRSSPYSKFSPQFNKDTLKTALLHNNIKYLFLGGELGARPDDRGCYVGNHVSFERLKKTAAFQQGIERLLMGMNDHEICLMCSEKEPIGCHRTILVSRVLVENGVTVQHVLENGKVIDQAEIEKQLMKHFKIEPDLFDNNVDILVKDAYERQEKDISYQLTTSGEGTIYW